MGKERAAAERGMIIVRIGRVENGETAGQGMVRVRRASWMLARFDGETMAERGARPWCESSRRLAGDPGSQHVSRDSTRFAGRRIGETGRG
jgi:hypothetical protein